MAIAAGLGGCGATTTTTVARTQAPRAPGAPAAKGPVLLGSKNFTTWGAYGFGIAHPTGLLVGGDPSVKIIHIRWQGWGRWSTSGVGSYEMETGLGGDYYRRPARALLQATGIGRCQTTGRAPTWR